MDTSTEVYATEIGESSGCIAEEAENQTLHTGQDVSDFYTSKMAGMMDCLQNSPTQSLFSLVNKVLDDSIERKDGNILLCMVYILKNVIQEIECRVSNQVEKNEKNEMEEKVKMEEQYILRLMKEKEQRDFQISTLKQELDATIKTYGDQSTQLVNQSQEIKLGLEKKMEELEKTLNESNNMAKELETFSKSKSMRLEEEELSYKKIFDLQCRVFEDLKSTSESLKPVLKINRTYMEKFHHLGINLKGLTEAAESYHVVLAENRKLFNEVQELKGINLKGLTEAAESYHVVLAENRKLYNEVQELKGNIRVYCRVRPFLVGQNKNMTTIEYIGENGELVVTNPLKHVKDGHSLFKFNKVFGPATTQEEVFLHTQPLIRSVLDGYNVCIFAYGQTGSGKTYTMSGPSISSKEEWGVNYRALSDLFSLSQTRKNFITYEVSVQMVEIYNEQVRDLLSNEASQKRLGILSTSQPNSYAVPDATIHSVKSTEDVLELMYTGQMNRAVGATVLNESSSRSHSILTVHVRGVDLKSDAILRGSLHLVDLAGSERVDRSEVTGDRLKEAQFINKSLSALGDVIFALAHKNAHVPYRNSKLTQVLQSSLGGQAKTLMFVQLNPDADSHSETISTLKFAERVSGVELGAAKRHKEAASLKEEEIARLRMVKANNANGERCGRGSPTHRFGSASPVRPSSASGGTRQRQSFSARKLPSLAKKAASDLSNDPDFSDKLSEAGFPPSVEDSRHDNDLPNNQFRLSVDGSQSHLSEYSENRLGQIALEEDVEQLGMGYADGEEILSDISNSGLSMGTETETDASIMPQKASITPHAIKPPASLSKIPPKPPKPPRAGTGGSSSARLLTIGKKDKTM